MWKFIVARSRNGVIGIDNSIPWTLRTDLRLFKEFTLGSTVVMGRETFDSIGKPLPGRRNVVLSRNKDLKIDNVDIIHNIGQISKFSNAIIIGGSKIYESTLKSGMVKTMQVTEVDCDIEGDSYFHFDLNRAKEVSRKSYKKSDKDEYDFSVISYSYK
jgi:dihydrofolate reductase